MSATHCKRGHERTPENIKPSGRCRPCHNLREQAFAKRRRMQQKVTTARAEQIEALRLENNIRGRDNYIERRRQRLAQQEKAA